MRIGDRIKARRIELGLTQADLARALGYKSKTTITKIEAGKNDIQQSKVVAFAKALDTTPAYLMGWTDDPDEQDEHAEQLERVAQWREKNPAPADTLDSDSYVEVETAAQEAVKDQLKAPDTAKFKDLKVQRSGNTFTFTGTFSAQNSFGAQLTEAYFGKAKKDGDNYTVTECTLGE